MDLTSAAPATTDALRRVDRPLRIGLLAAVGIGWIFEFLFAYFSQPTLTDATRVFSLLWLTSGAAFFVGGITGFVFGVPRTRTADDIFGSRRHDNTNLEEISDWLTKILVGLGLVEFRPVIDFLGSISAQIGAPIDAGQGGANLVALSSLLFGFICGFVYFYLWARVWFQHVPDNLQDSAAAAAAAHQRSSSE
jgi:hypothetical protein